MTQIKTSPESYPGEIQELQSAISKAEDNIKDYWERLEQLGEKVEGQDESEIRLMIASTEKVMQKQQRDLWNEVYEIIFNGPLHFEKMMQQLQENYSITRKQ